MIHPPTRPPTLSTWDGTRAGGSPSIFPSTLFSFSSFSSSSCCCLFSCLFSFLLCRALALLFRLASSGVSGEEEERWVGRWCIFLWTGGRKPDVGKEEEEEEGAASTLERRRLRRRRRKGVLLCVLFFFLLLLLLLVVVVVVLGM